MRLTAGAGSRSRRFWRANCDGEEVHNFSPAMHNTLVTDVARCILYGGAALCSCRRTYEHPYSRTNVLTNPNYPPLWSVVA
jgi:hypothetical protein